MRFYVLQRRGLLQLNTGNSFALMMPTATINTGEIEIDYTGMHAGGGRKGETNESEGCTGRGGREESWFVGRARIYDVRHVQLEIARRCSVARGTCNEQNYAADLHIHRGRAPCARVCERAPARKRDEMNKIIINSRRRDAHGECARTYRATPAVLIVRHRSRGGKSNFARLSNGETDAPRRINGKRARIYVCRMCASRKKSERIDDLRRVERNVVPRAFAYTSKEVSFSA